MLSGLGTAGVLTTLHDFTGGSDGANPVGGLLQANDGKIYGTTTQGGIATGHSLERDNGVIFEMDASGFLTVMYSFKSGVDSSFPAAR